MQKLLHSTFLLLTLGCLVLAGTGCSREAKKASYLKSGDTYYAAGDLEKAEVEYLNVLKLEPGNGHAIGKLGLIYSDQGRLSRAIPFVRRGHDLQPEDLDLRLKLAQIYLASGKHLEAKTEINYVLDHRPADPEAPLLLVGTITKPENVEEVRTRLQGLPAPARTSSPVLTALAMMDFGLGKPKEAEAAIRQVLAADPKFVEANALLGSMQLLQKDTTAADQSFKLAAEASRPRSPRRVQYAQFKIRSGDPAAGRALLEAMTKKTPDYVPAWVALAELAFTEKKMPECTSLIGQILARDPDNIEGRLLSGRVHLVKGENAEALKEFGKLADELPTLSVAHYELARAQLASGDTGKALTSLTQAISLSPKYSDAVLLLAGLQIRRGDYSAAIAILRKLAPQRPDLPQATLLLAEAYRAQGNPADALALYDQIDKLYPQNTQTALLRGQVLAQQGKLAEARDAWIHAQTIMPGNPAPLEQLVNLDLRDKNYAGARARVDAALAAYPKMEAAAQLLYAKIFLAQGDFAQAETALLKVTKLAPDNPTVYVLLAGIYNRAHQIPKALASMKEAAARNPRDTSTLMIIAVLHDQQKDYSAAREAYDKVLAVNPDAIAALNNLAYLYSEKLGQIDKALELAQRARDLAPTDPNVADTLGWIFYKQHQYPRALGLLEEAAEKQPTSQEIQYHLGMTHYMLGEEEPARLALQKALQPGTDFAGAAEARKALAVLEIDTTRDATGARAALEQSLAEHKDDPVALARLAAIHEREGRTDQAISSLESALQVSPKNVNVLVSLARLHAAKKDYSKALSYAKTARQLAPDDAVIAHTLGRLAYEMGEYAWASSLLQESARKQAATPDLLFELAEAVYSVGRVAEAETALRDALTPPANPGSAPILFTRAGEARQFLDLIGLAANPAEAVKQSARLEQILKADPANVPALMASGAANEQKLDAAAARQNYEKALARFPDFSPAKLRLAVLGAALPEFDRKYYDWALQARSVYPTNPELAKALGILTYRKGGDAARAVSLLKESSAARGNDAETFYYLGQAQLQAKDLPGARLSLQKALDLGLRADLAAEARKAMDAAK